jgi:hypothetical protein
LNKNGYVGEKVICILGSVVIAYANYWKGMDYKNLN